MGVLDTPQHPSSVSTGHSTNTCHAAQLHPCISPPLTLRCLLRARPRDRTLVASSHHDTASVCAARKHVRGSLGRLGSASDRFLLLWDALRPSCLCLWSPLIALCWCPILSGDLQKELDVQRAASGRPYCAPFTTVLPPEAKEPLGYLVLLHRGVRMCLWAPRGCRGASTSDLCALGGDLYLGLDWSWDSLVYWCHLGGICCGVMHEAGPGLMSVQRPGRQVASCGVCRRVKLIAVVWCCWPALVG